MKLNSIEKLIKQQFNKDNETISLLFHIKHKFINLFFNYWNSGRNSEKYQNIISG